MSRSTISSSWVVVGSTALTPLSSMAPQSGPIGVPVSRSERTGTWLTRACASRSRAGGSRSTISSRQSGQSADSWREATDSPPSPGQRSAKASNPRLASAARTASDTSDSRDVSASLRFNVCG